MPDLVTFGEATLRLSPPRGTRLETASRFDGFVGGPACGVAVAAAQLGGEAVWLSRLPDSPLGRRVVRELRGHGVRTGVSWADGETARVATHYRERGVRPGATGTRHERTGGAVADVSVDELPLQPVRTASAFGVSGVTPALSDRAREATAALLEVAAESDTATVFDATYRRELWRPGAARETFEALFDRVDVLVVDRADAVEVLGTTDRRVELAHGLATAHDLRTVVVTWPDGTLALHDGEVHERPTLSGETVDPVGTRPAFVGGFLTARLDGETVPAALDRGRAAAALKRTVEGDLLVATAAEVDDVVERDG